MSARKRLLAGLCAITISCASCVPCDHPLCDQESSVADDVLIGDWLIKLDEHQAPLQISIGRKPGAENVLELVAPDGVDDEGEVTFERHDIFTTKVRSLRLATYENDRDGEDDPKTYSIWLLESPDEDTVNVYMMDEQVVAKAIEAKQLRGKIRKWWLFGWFAEVTRITSTADELRRYIAAAGKSCFMHDEPIWTLKRTSQQLR